jgi:hypothetical protein
MHAPAHRRAIGIILGRTAVEQSSQYPLDCKDGSLLAPGDYVRWLGEEPDPRDLMRPFPADLTRMWPISTRVNKPENDDPSIIEPIEVATDVA